MSAAWAACILILLGTAAVAQADGTVSDNLARLNAAKMGVSRT